MTRGFGIDASVPLEVAMEVAGLVERAGYGSFWVNGSPHEQALSVIDGALERTELDIGVGVFPLTEISAEELVNEVRERSLPQSRLWLGVGSNRSPGALDEVRQAAHTFRAELDVNVVTGAVGPKMMALAAEVADAAVLTWSFAAEVERAREILNEAASAAGREVPPVISFVRCGLLPQAKEAVEERARAYAAIPRYQEVFDRHGIEAVDAVVTGRNRAELLEGIIAEEEVLDLSVIRAIPAENTTESLAELVRACAP
ncbi:MAG TPA: LLM class flavin-dependent oxidoreductase [Acidimicrobiia bacterium]|nr:LLM class flavin-dependent oxidoreductase [Acidimicrobiia bacterium]